MTKETEKLAQSIQTAQAVHRPTEDLTEKKHQSGYAIVSEMLTDLIGCVIVGLALGIFFQRMFGAPALLTAGLTFLGTVAGLGSVIRTGIRLSKQG